MRSKNHVRVVGKFSRKSEPSPSIVQFASLGYSDEAERVKKAPPQRLLALINSSITSPYMQQPHEGFMANLFKLHRRDFLVTAVALTTSGAARGIKGAPESATTPITSAPSSIPLYPNVAAHLAEIGRRNNLRQESGLPLLSISRELRRIKTAEVPQHLPSFAKPSDRGCKKKCLPGFGGGAVIRIGNQTECCRGWRSSMR